MNKKNKKKNDKKIEKREKGNPSQGERQGRGQESPPRSCATFDPLLVFDFFFFFVNHKNAERDFL